MKNCLRLMPYEDPYRKTSAPGEFSYLVVRTRYFLPVQQHRIGTTLQGRGISTGALCLGAGSKIGNLLHRLKKQ